MWCACSMLLPIMRALNVKIKKLLGQVFALFVRKQQKTLCMHYSRLQCRSVMNLWASVFTATPQKDLRDFANWCEGPRDYAKFKKMKKKQQLVTICWAIWNRWDSHIWHHGAPLKSTCSKLSNPSCGTVAVWDQTGLNDTQKGPSATSSRRWIPPPTGCLKYNVDATLFPAKNMIGCGFVVHDDRIGCRISELQSCPTMAE